MLRYFALVFIFDVSKSKFRFYRGATPENCDATERASRTGCRHTHRYGNGNMAAQTTWPPEVDHIFLRNMNTEYML
jgi:hypothetical protein